MDLFENISALPYGFCLKTYDTVSSTSDLVKDAARNGAPEGYTVTAKMQTAGRGRMGRSFYSPEGTGLYISTLLRPSIAPRDALLITTAAAVAVSRTLEGVGCNSVGVKWVNDIFINGRKVCGILTESAISADGRSLDYAVLGIGINLAPPKDGFPDDIKDTAGAVFDSAENLTEEWIASLTAKLIAEVYSLYSSLPERDFMKEYKYRSILVGKKVSVSSGETNIDGTAVDITDTGDLIIQTADGSLLPFSSGEARINGIY